MTTHTPLRYGMIGCGMMGQEHLKNIALLDAVMVTIIFEPDEIMRGIAQTLAPKARFVSSIEQVLEAHTELDALVITSPNHCHAQQLQTICSKVQLPILLEKPAAISIVQVQQLRHIVQTYTAPIWIAMEYRYMPAIAALLKHSHEEKDTGGTVMLSIREHRYPFLTKVNDWNRFNANTGGTLVEKCCHFFDLMRLIMKQDPIRVYASGGANHNHQEESYEGQTPDILDNAYVILDFPNKQRAMLELCMFAEGSQYQETITVVGPHGKLECLVPGPSRFWSPELGTQPLAQLHVLPRNPSHQGPPKIAHVPVDASLLAAGDHNGSTFYQHQKFAQVVRKTAEVEVTLQDGLKAVLIGLAAECSVKTGLAIDLSTGDYQL